MNLSLTNDIYLFGVLYQSAKYCFLSTAKLGFGLLATTWWDFVCTSVFPCTHDCVHKSSIFHYSLRFNFKQLFANFRGYSICWLCHIHKIGTVEVLWFNCYKFTKTKKYCVVFNFYLFFYEACVCVKFCKRITSHLISGFVSELTLK